MEITEVTITLNEDESSKIKAWADILIDDCFVIKNIEITDSKRGLYLQYPNIKDRKGGRGACFPADKETSHMITMVVLQAYKNVLADYKGVSTDV
jgi:DNA-binding cell septation regulator SpoVG